MCSGCFVAFVAFIVFIGAIGFVAIAFIFVKDINTFNMEDWNTDNLIVYNKQQDVIPGIYEKTFNFLRATTVDLNIRVSQLTQETFKGIRMFKTLMSSVTSVTFVTFVTFVTPASIAVRTTNAFDML